MSGVIRVKQNRTWAPARGLYVKQSGSWTPAEKAFIKQNGSWVQIYPADAGVLSADPSSLSFSAYEDYVSSTRTIVLSNTGNDTITVNSLNITQSSKFTIQLVSGGTTPFTIVPGGNRIVTLKMLANKRGTRPRTTVEITGTASLNVGYNIGVLGNTTSSFDIAGTVLPDYADISVIPTSISYSTYFTGPLPSATITVYNNGNGGDMTINSVTSASGITTIDNDVTGLIPSGSSTRIHITAPSGRSAGTHGDTIYINTSEGTINVPVTLTVDALSTGVNEYIVPGTYSWTVPTGITSIDMELQGGGGGGGGSTEVGNGAGGGGGGAGAYAAYALSVTPGETITIKVGAGGAGAPEVGRNPGRNGLEGPGKDGSESYIVRLSGTSTAPGGKGGSSGYSTNGGDYGPGTAGGGGAGGNNAAPGQSGESGSTDGSSVSGGAGGASYYSPGGAGGAPGSSTGKNGYKGSGGGGAGTTDRVSPYNWGGGNGGNGYVKISW